MPKVWFVTGAGSGIGAGTVKAALAAGDQVVATGRDLAKVRNAVGDDAGDHLALAPLDVTDEAEARAAIGSAVARFGRIDVLVNNAGNSFLGNFEELTNQEIERQFATNFWGVVNVLRAALPVMRRQRAGYILNISSVAGVTGQLHCSAYGAAKFAVEGLSLSLVEEVKKFGVTLTIVEPGFFKTELLDTRNVTYAESKIDDYAAEGSAAAMWSRYDGKQTGDPRKLGEALVALTRMARPPRFFLGGGDAIDDIKPVLERRLSDIRDHEGLTRSTNLAPA